jgi:cell division protein FtsN
MRDIDKLKEKIELSLDNSQVVSLVVGSLLVLGVVFVLGVMVGKQLAVPTGSPPPQDVLAALDKAALDKMAAAKAPEPKPEPKLDFQETLPGPVANSIPPRYVPEPEPKAKPASKPESKAEAKPEPKAEAKPEPKPEPKVEPKAKVEAKAELEAKPEPKAEPKPAPVMDSKLADAFAKAGTNQGSKPKEIAAVAAPKDGFTVQVAASQEKSEADQVVSKLRSSGMSPYLVDAEIPGKGRWYRVRVGSFHSRDEAERYAKDLKRETGLNGAFATSAR